MSVFLIAQEESSLHALEELSLEVIGNFLLAKRSHDEEATDKQKNLIGFHFTLFVLQSYSEWISKFKWLYFNLA